MIFGRCRLCFCLSERGSCSSRRRGLLRGGPFLVCIVCTFGFWVSSLISCNKHSRGLWRGVLFLESNCCIFLSPCLRKSVRTLKTLCKRPISVRFIMEERHTIYVVRTFRKRAHNMTRMCDHEMFAQSARANLAHLSPFVLDEKLTIEKGYFDKSC